MSINPDELTVVDNPDKQRYEITVGDHVAHADYNLSGNTIVFTHTEVPKELEGGGIGSKLARFVLDDSRARGRAVIPECPFITAYIRRHQEYLDLVPADQQYRVKA